MQAWRHRSAVMGDDFDDAFDVVILIDEFLERKGFGEAGLRGREVLDPGDDSFGHAPAERQLDIVTRGAHRGRDDDAVDEDLQGFLDGDVIATGRNGQSVFDANDTTTIYARHRLSIIVNVDRCLRKWPPSLSI